MKYIKYTKDYDNQLFEVVVVVIKLLLTNNHKNFNSIAPLTPTLAPKTGGTM